MNCGSREHDIHLHMKRDAGLKKGELMKKFIFILIFAAFTSVSCVAAVRPYGADVAVAPHLPIVVELVDSYYVYSGYHYHYHQNRWYYSKTKDRHWKHLPKERYPREVRFKKKRNETHRGDERYRKNDSHRDSRHRESDRYRGDRHRRNDNHREDDKYRRSYRDRTDR